jgi:hypothetical protein
MAIAWHNEVRIVRILEHRIDIRWPILLAWRECRRDTVYVGGILGSRYHLISPAIRAHFMFLIGNGRRMQSQKTALHFRQRRVAARVDVPQTPPAALERFKRRHPTANRLLRGLDPFPAAVRLATLRLSQEVRLQSQNRSLGKVGWLGIQHMRR